MVGHGASVRSSEVHSIGSTGSIEKCEAVERIPKVVVTSVVSMVGHGTSVRSSEVHSSRSTGSIVMSALVAVAISSCLTSRGQLKRATATGADITMEPVLLLLWTSLDLTDVPWPTILTTLVTTTFRIRSTAL